MGFALDSEAAPRREIVRVIDERLDDAITRLAGLIEADALVDLEPTVHAVRKRCKETRALARLLRVSHPDEFRSFNDLARDASAQLSELRDSHALLATLRTLAGTDLAARSPGFAEVEQALSVAAEHSNDGVRSADPRLLRASDLLIEARVQVDHWKIDKGFATLAEGAARNYRQGRNALRAARRKPTDEHLHEWRKRSKQLWYHTRFFRSLAPSVLRPSIEQLDALSDALGDDHDLAVLNERLRTDPESYGGKAAAAEVIALAAPHRRVLQERSLRLGATLYAETPDAYRERLQSYWRSTRRFGEEKRVLALAGLVDDAREAAESPTTIERERKWLIDEAPADLPAGVRLRQGYVAQDADASVRVREAGAAGCTATVKSGTGAVRTEVEWPISRAEFDALWPSTENRRVAKTRHRLPWGSHTIEVDVFAGDLDGLVVAEVEFDSDDAMQRFEPPTWFGLDVTHDGRYSNASLARDGLPVGPRSVGAVLRSMGQPPLLPP